MIKQRETAVRGILKVCKAMLDRYSTSQVQCIHSPKSQHCDHIILAFLFKTFKNMGIMAFEYTAVADLSLERLVKTLQDIKIKHLTSGGTKETKHSETCDPMEKMLSELKVVMDRIVPLRLESFGRVEPAISWETWEMTLRVGVSRQK